MKLTIKFKFTEEYVPPRCRKPRYRDMESSTTVNLREITADEAPVALIVTDYETRYGECGVYTTEYRWYKNKLYTLCRNRYGVNMLAPYEISDVIEDLEGVGRQDKTICNPLYFHYHEEQSKVKMLRGSVKRFLMIAGEIWSESSEPRYVIHTFGLGHNHGGSSLSIHNGCNNNIGKDRYFNALQREEAIRRFEQIAFGRGDTESVHDEYVDNIQVLIPEAVKCNPR